ncbi:MULTISPECIES: hypothetical protein [unclassified Streptomyces]|uniref:hypothetical protein n=1 Tax=unclassified Streptomyces TaxID=2593676 RepID=UPI002E0F1AA8|nr:MULTISPECIES: hypothetical protein [unclassified Streptomyces]WSR23776.1 hypothetical protein OG573_35050 [Streptomyces sp. NBC_01205]
MDPAAVLALLDRLEHRAELRHVLAAGHHNHHRSPGAWHRAVRARSRGAGQVR